MPTRVSTFTYATLGQLMSAAAWNQWVDSWNTWLSFMASVGFSGTSSLSHGAAGGTALPRATVLLLQQNLDALVPQFYQDVSPVNATAFWPTHTSTTARAAAGLSGTNWTRQWFRRVANTTSATAYLDGDAFVTGELAWNMADGRVYLRGASSWALQPRNTFPTVKSGSGQAQAYDIITSTLFNELAAVHQVLYYRNGNYLSNPTFPNYLWSDDGYKTGQSPTDNPPFTAGDTTAASAESDADAAFAAATASFSDTVDTDASTGAERVGGEVGGPAPAKVCDLSHQWRDSSYDWWRATRSVWPKKYGGNWSTAAPTGLVVELWAKIIRPGTVNLASGAHVVEYEGPYAEDSIQQFGTVTRGGGGTGYIHVDLGSVSAWPALTARSYNNWDSNRRGSQLTLSQTRTDLRTVMPAP